MRDGETIDRCVRKNVVLLSAHQAAHYGGYAPAATVFSPAIILPPSLVPDHWQDLEHLPFFLEVGHA
jgi:hypothetical protein